MRTVPGCEDASSEATEAFLDVSEPNVRPKYKTAAKLRAATLATATVAGVQFAQSDSFWIRLREPL
jgi:hypothetical protein